jgi:hypothetical protein
LLFSNILVMMMMIVVKMKMNMIIEMRWITASIYVWQINSIINTLT